MECISVTAFVQLALELMAVSAPSALIARAWSAAADELRHTALCAALADRLGAGQVVYTLPEVNVRPVDSRAALLERIAVESYERWLRRRRRRGEPAHALGTRRG
jgi:hypothetical protein